MTLADEALATLIAKDEIRELAMLYSRGVDRKDLELLATLYTADGVDTHGKYYQGSAEGYIRFLAESLPHFPYSGHHICNHLVSVSGDVGEGEVYVVAYHIIPDGKGGYVEDIQNVRYLDQYRKEDGRWKFAARNVVFDMHTVRPYPTLDGPPSGGREDLSYDVLAGRLFARGPRA
jgi:ketosteroid isomerase-like protein